MTKILASRSESSTSDVGIDVPKTFSLILKDDPFVATAVAAIKTLIEVLKNCPSTTLQELIVVLRDASSQMTTQVDCSASSVRSGCDLFLQFITLQSSRLEEGTFEEMRKMMLKKGHHFLDMMSQSRSKVAKMGAPHIADNSKILVHARSRTVLAMLDEALKLNKHFHVFVTEGSNDQSGRIMVEELKEKGIPCTLILDASIGYVMSEINLVLLGAEGVVESGGILNRLGSYTIALCAKELNKPLYVICESYKFVRLYPLNQQDIPNEFKYYASTLREKGDDLSQVHPLVDYTPPAFIKLLFTDLGILTPSAVSDELIKLYPSRY